MRIDLWNANTVFDDPLALSPLQSATALQLVSQLINSLENKLSLKPSGYQTLGCLNNQNFVFVKWRSGTKQIFDLIVIVFVQILWQLFAIHRSAG